MRNVMNFFKVAVVAISLTCASVYGVAQENANTAKGQMKESGKEAKKAGTGMARHMKHGRIVRGGKTFGKHTWRSGKHFGRGTKKAVKHAIS